MVPISEKVALGAFRAIKAYSPNNILRMSGGHHGRPGVFTGIVSLFETGSDALPKAPVARVLLSQTSISKTPFHLGRDHN
jgi:hypothetical protein